jgi:hypothetical protein
MTDIAVTFGAQIAPLQAGAAQAAASVAQATAGIRETLANVAASSQSFLAGWKQSTSEAAAAASGLHSHAGSALANLASTVQGAQGAVAAGLGAISKAFAGLSAVLAGGEIFRDVVRGAAEWTGQVTVLARQLGITSEQASVLAVALQRNGLSVETYSSAFAMLTRQMRQNEPALLKLGIVTRDNNGHLLDGQQAMTNALKTIALYPEGTARAIAGQTAFGRGAQEVSGLLKLLREDFNQDAQLAEKLGLVIGRDAAAALREYKLNLAEVALVGTAFEVAIGSQVVGALASMRGPLTTAINLFAGLAAAIRDAASTIENFGDLTKKLLPQELRDAIDAIKQIGGYLQLIGIVGQIATMGIQSTSGRGPVATAPIPPANAPPGPERMRAWLLANGYTPQAAAAIMGNAAVESGFNPAARNATGHFGLFQWDKNRQQPLNGSTDFDEQMRLMDKELSQRDPSFKTATAPAGVLADRFERVFEQSGGQNRGERIKRAEGYARDSAAGAPPGQTFDEQALKALETQTNDAYRNAEIAARHSVETQIRLAEENVRQQQRIVRSEFPLLNDEEAAKDERVLNAQYALNQKKAQLYDQDTQLYIARLREQQAATTDPKRRVALQEEIVRTVESGGRNVPDRSPLGTRPVGVDPLAVQQARNELAALQRQDGQESVRLEEQRLSHIRQMGQLGLEEYTAQEQRKVALGQESQLQALQNQATATREFLDQQILAANALLMTAQAAGLSAEQLDKFFDKLTELGLEARTKAAQFGTQIVDAQKAILDRWVQPVKQAFDQIGSSIEGAISGILTRQKTWAQAIADIGNSAVQGLVSSAGSVLSKLAARGIFGAQNGEGFGEALFKWGADQLGLGNLLGLGQTAATTANTAALAANTAALGAMTVALGGSAAASAAGGAASVAGGAASAAGAAAGGGGFFSWLGGLLAFSRGGIVPSAASGWALPSFAGATPALLHSREMVLPAPISEGLQQMIGSGGGGAGDMHVHIHEIANDAPAIERLFRNNGRLITDALRAGLRSNALTPRTI